jgi:hypothetical protein
MPGLLRIPTCLEIVSWLTAGCHCEDPRADTTQIPGRDRPLQAYGGEDEVHLKLSQAEVEQLPEIPIHRGILQLNG